MTFPSMPVVHFFTVALPVPVWPGRHGRHTLLFLVCMDSSPRTLHTAKLPAYGMYLAVPHPTMPTTSHPNQTAAFFPTEHVPAYPQPGGRGRVVPASCPHACGTGTCSPTTQAFFYTGKDCGEWRQVPPSPPSYHWGQVPHPTTWCVFQAPSMSHPRRGGRQTTWCLWGCYWGSAWYTALLPRGHGTGGKAGEW